MAFGAEVTGKLGIDTSSVPADLEKAKSAFQKFGQDAEATGGRAGDGAGGKFTTALEHRLLGARHLTGALATALGLNIENIAKTIAATMVGGTEEAWKRMGELADENAKLIEKKIELALTPKGVQDKIKKDAAAAAAAAQVAGQDTAGEAAIKKFSPTQAFQDNVTKLGQLFGLIRSDAERAIKIGEAENKSLETNIRLEEQKKAIKESHQKLDEYRAAAAEKNLTDSQKQVAEDAEVDKILAEIVSGKLTEKELDEHHKRLIDIQAAEDARAAAAKQREIDQAKELLRLQESLNEAHRKLARDEEDLANKKADRGKETIAEIAKLKPGKTGPEGNAGPVDTFGLSAEAASAKETAVEIERLQKQAEQLRTSGDVGGANELFNQIGAKKDTLVASGFAKSTEGDNFKQLEETIHKDNEDIMKLVGSIAAVAKGKLRNE